MYFYTDAKEANSSEILDLWIGLRVEVLYSLTSPYGHLHNTDTSLLRTVRLVPEMPKIIHSLPP